MRLNLTSVCHLFFVRCFEDVFFKNGLNGIDVTIFKIFLLLYVDDIVLFADSKAELQTSLNVLHDYFQKCKLVGNTNKKKLMVFKKRIRLSNNLKFYYNNLEIESVNKVTYLGIVFSTGGSFSNAQMNKQFNNFTNLTVKHRIDLYDKLIYPNLSYCSEVWGFVEGTQIERVCACNSVKSYLWIKGQL